MLLSDHVYRFCWWCVSNKTNVVLRAEDAKDCCLFPILSGTKCRDKTGIIQRTFVVRLLKSADFIALFYSAVVGWKIFRTSFLHWPKDSDLSHSWPRNEMEKWWVISARGRGVQQSLPYSVFEHGVGHVSKVRSDSYFTWLAGLIYPWAETQNKCHFLVSPASYHHVFHTRAWCISRVFHLIMTGPTGTHYHSAQSDWEKPYEKTTHLGVL